MRLQPLTLEQIQQLTQGDILLIKAGCPSPLGNLAEDKTVIVAAVDGYSFLTTEGEGFGGCFLEGHIYKTGHTREIALSPEAQKILERLKGSHLD